jgi:AAA+ ATPase superfamily predicted ATPase
MRNVTGVPVEDDDFFDRGHEIERFLQEIRNNANLLLTTPRRVGKTSLVLRLCRVLKGQNFAVAFFDVEGCSDELAFAEKLVETLRSEGLQPKFLQTMLNTLRKLRSGLGRIKVGAGVNIELDDISDAGQGTLSRLLESVFQKLEEEGQAAAIAIDELPELLLTISKEEHGPQRVTQLLHWLRYLRQTYRRVRWIFLGSVGLDNFVEERQLSKTINDLTRIGLDAFTVAEAQAFLEKLGRDNGLFLDEPTRTAVLGKIGWPLPYHLQLIFQALRDLGQEQVGPQDVERAWENLLLPHGLSHFDTWRQRLDEQFNRADATAAKTILKHLCRHPEGRTRGKIFDALMADLPSADPRAVEEQLARLLLVLQRDGYLLSSQDQYTFRSPLLREYWYRWEVR